MEIAQVKSILGCVLYALALPFLSVSVVAAVSTWRTGRFSSGLHIVPTIFAVIGGISTGWWKASFVIVVLDLGLLFLKSARSKRRLLAAVMLGLLGCSPQRQADNIALPFVNDPEVIGQWETVDFVRAPDDFKPGAKSWPEELAFADLVFSAEGKTSRVWTWTKGVLIHSGDKTASEYVIKSVEKTPYLFFQWKSGDYIRRGKEPWYYVLKKAK